MLQRGRAQLSAEIGREPGGRLLDAGLQRGRAQLSAEIATTNRTAKFSFCFNGAALN